MPIQNQINILQVKQPTGAMFSTASTPASTLSRLSGARQGLERVETSVSDWRGIALPTVAPPKLFLIPDKGVQET